LRNVSRKRPDSTNLNHQYIFRRVDMDHPILSTKAAGRAALLALVDR
jgi:hypothetical protein